MSFLPKRKSSGQALLLVLLSMAVILVVVLSILSRSILDVAITTGEEDALRAFSAAEAGIERALIIGLDIGSTQIGDAEFSANVTGFASGTTDFVYPTDLVSGESVVLWFVAHDADGNFDCSVSTPCFTGDTIKLCWGKEGTSGSSTTTPAVEMNVVYTEVPGDYSTAKIVRITIDPYDARRASNNFSARDAGTCTVGGNTLAFQKTVDLAALGIPAGVLSSENGLQYARINMFYNTTQAHKIGVDANFPGNSTLPAQGLKVSSTGTAGTANRKIEVFQGFGEIPPILDAAIFSTGGFVK